MLAFSSSPPAQGQWNEKMPALGSNQSNALVPVTPASSKVNEATARSSAPVFRMPKDDIFDIGDFLDGDSPELTSVSRNPEPGKSTGIRSKEYTSASNRFPTATPLDCTDIAERRLKRFAVNEDAEISALASIACPPTRLPVESSGMNLISSHLAGQSFDLMGD